MLKDLPLNNTTVLFHYCQELVTTRICQIFHSPLVSYGYYLKQRGISNIYDEFLRKRSTANNYYFHINTPSQMFGRILNSLL